MYIYIYVYVYIYIYIYVYIYIYIYIYMYSVTLMLPYRTKWICYEMGLLLLWDDSLVSLHTFLFLHLISVVKPVNIFRDRQSFKKLFNGWVFFPSFCAFLLFCNNMFWTDSLIAQSVRASGFRSHSGQLSIATPKNPSVVYIISHICLWQSPGDWTYL